MWRRPCTWWEWRNTLSCLSCFSFGYRRARARGEAASISTRHPLMWPSLINGPWEKWSSGTVGVIVLIHWVASVSTKVRTGTQLILFALWLKIIENLYPLLGYYYYFYYRVLLKNLKIFSRVRTYFCLWRDPPKFIFFVPSKSFNFSFAPF